MGLGSGSSPPEEAAAGNLGLLDLTWRKGEVPRTATDSRVGGRWAGAHLERVAGSDPSCLPSCAQRGLSDLEQGPGKGGRRKKSGCEPHLVRHRLVRGCPGAEPPSPSAIPAAARAVEWGRSEDGAWAPFKARGALPGPFVGSQREEWGSRRDPPKPRAQSAMSPPQSMGTQQGQGAARREVGFVWKG